ncbi:hypothetical protein F5Y03DRAFT_117900 [Xylaria venustula]|nr:hypothetical protein F5Y03DRAFT_117900 [Xylaria venustula]
MSKKKRVSPSQDNTTPGSKLLPHLQVWYCYKCGFGPLTTALDEYCANCGKQRCGLSLEEWVPAEEEQLHDISAPRGNKEPRPEALPTASHVPHTCDRRAATPSDNAENAISEIGFPISPLLPYPLYPPRTIGTGTDISTSTHTRVPAQEISEVALEQWNVSQSNIGLVPIPIQESFHSPWSPFDVPHLPSGSPRGSNSLYTQITAEFDLCLDYLHNAGDTNHSVVGTSLSIQQHPLDPRSRLKRKHVAVDNGSTDAGDQPTQLCAGPILPDGMATGPVSFTGWLGFPIDASTQLPVDSQVPGNSIRPIPPPWTSTGDSIAPTQPAPSSTKTLQGGRATKTIPQPHECCKSDENRRLACPFYKYDPELYINCVLKSFKDISHLNQHLKSKHKLGANHCQLCWRTFDTADALTSHAKLCKLPTGGVPVDKLPKFPRMGKTSMPKEKKWYWGWKNLFGEAVVPPPCPFSHPREHIQIKLRVQRTEESHVMLGGNGSLSFTDFAGDDDESSLSTLPDWPLPDGEKHRATSIRILPEELDLLSNSYLAANVPSSTQPWDFESET